VLLPRGIVYFNGAHLHLHRRKYHRKGAAARHYLRLFWSREQELELHYPSRARFRDSHCSDRALGFKPRETTRIVGQAFPPAAFVWIGNRERLPYNAIFIYGVCRFGPPACVPAARFAIYLRWLIVPNSPCC